MSVYINCHDAIAQLYDYLSGELDDEMLATIRNHLDLCAPCEGTFAFETRLRAMVITRCAESAPDALRTRIAAELETA
jgi:mycothiol system anti-sigma-R factor